MTLGGGDRLPERIKQALESGRIQQWVWFQAGLPFREAPQECKDFLQALVPVGPIASAQEFARQTKYLTGKRTPKAPELSVKKPL